ncbi:hypothetical protein [Brevibacillus migulae]|uniref:hypothetical protein n=1 Tax=Brevibacillus migulae TaxID=1644114 RepID=UPI00106E13F7|nr:hypothetical protein [Brevibacillus migulae]
MVGEISLLFLLINHYHSVNEVVLQKPVYYEIKNNIESNVTRQADVVNYLKNAPRPEKITARFFQMNNETKLQWINSLNTWTSNLLTLSYKQKTYQIDEKAKMEIVTALSNYYSIDQADRLFSVYYKRSPEGTYEYLETESISRINLIEKNLKIQNRTEGNSHVIEITGQFIDVVNGSEYVTNEIREQYFFSRTDFRLINIKRSIR